MSNEPEIKDDAGRSFAHLLIVVRDGDVNAEASRELATVLQRVEEEALARGKAKGSITVTINFAADDRGHVAVTSDVKTKLPKPALGAGHMWLLKGKLGADNPRQVKLPLREVPNPNQQREPEGGQKVDVR